MAFLALPDLLVRSLVSAVKAIALEVRLGPPSPDVVLAIDRPVVGLRVESREAKAWAIHQAIRKDGDFFRVTTVHRVERERRVLYRYDLRRLDDEEVIRGDVLCFVVGSGEPQTWYGRVIWRRRI